MKHIRFLAAKTVLAAALTGSIITPVQAGIPVIDGGNLVQNVMTAIESVAQTLKQIEQYQTLASSNGSSHQPAQRVFNDSAG